MGDMLLNVIKCVLYQSLGGRQSYLKISNPRTLSSLHAILFEGKTKSFYSIQFRLKIDGVELNCNQLIPNVLGLNWFMNQDLMKIIMHKPWCIILDVDLIKKQNNLHFIASCFQNRVSLCLLVQGKTDGSMVPINGQKKGKLHSRKDSKDKRLQRRQSLAGLYSSFYLIPLN